MFFKRLCCGQGISLIIDIKAALTDQVGVFLFLTPFIEIRREKIKNSKTRGEKQRT